MKILAFAGSNSSTSINKRLISSVAKYYKEPDDIIEVLDLNDYEVPIFSVDRERDNGIPELIIAFSKKMDNADFLLISLAENNGNYTVAYKNIVDWLSRIKGRKIFNNKPIFLLATSDGRRGAQTVLDIATARIPFDGGEILETFSLPSFRENFEEGKGVISIQHRSQLEAKVRKTKRLLQAKLGK
ncbi:NAD(P)H-dependent oxidoreductase [Sphingobacterium sp. UT-1RO-CII-1]|uniref:NADPH-dependent FMN reductase n=1 Tax=Sphingobacterium sp. UT-1RO-CII-1 TaxID=2995225 RepID=UPI00227B2C5D|nr:NAD(P)H-dependent oxidoreductase [Sphingobacterium sp. UT-1RO-CII-1]MCY4781489.1 NAD(P)H-dependent oxidoreductase [Sphingobacterium sp. UT-1RO-CII-1]